MMRVETHDEPLSLPPDRRLSSFEVLKSHTCTVPLSLLTAIAPPSFLKLNPKISAVSVPLLNSLIKRLLVGSQTLTRVPCLLVVASKEPEGVVESAESADV